MNVILNPIINFLDKMNFGKRFLMLSMIIFMTLLTVSWLYIKNEYQERVLLKSEIEPVRYYEPAIDLMQKLAISRNLHILLFKKADDTSISSKVAEADANVDAALSNLKNINLHGWTTETINHSITNLDTNWNKLKTDISHGYSEDLLVKHQKVADLISDILESTADGSSIGLDTDPITTQLTDLFLKNAPQAAEDAIDLRGLGIDVLLSKQATPVIRERINYVLALSDYENSNLESSIKQIIEIDNIYAKLFNSSMDMISKNYVSNTVNRDILQPSTLTRSPSEFGDEMNGYVNNYFSIADTAYKAFNERFAARINSIDNHIATAAIGLSAIFALICLIFLAFYKSTDRAVRQLIANANAMASGDLSKDMEMNRSDEFGLLMVALSNMQKKISEIVMQIKNTSNIVGRGAVEISQGNLDLSKRTEQQASSLAATAASMEELSVTVKENARQSKKAAELAEHAREQADSSGKVVNNAVDAMTKINASSKKIAEISGVIDEIAFQTNLLALNAAIEAARAGEQGRGFAVVAQEVRNLAQRSSTAAKEINTLITDSVDKISTGAELVTKSGDALQEIVKSASSVSELVGSMATATSQQSQGLDEINKAITQMDGITQQNAALVEETAAASENVNQQVRDLIKQIDFFKDSKGAEQIVLAEPAPITMPLAHAKTSPIHVEMPSDKKVDLKSYIPKGERKSSDQDWSEF